MDDVSFQNWSDQLTALRTKRQSVIDMLVKEKAASYLPDEFYDGMSASLENIMETWLEFERASWDSAPPLNLKNGAAISMSEMESILDFEIDAIERDRASVVTRTTWDPSAVESAEASFKTFTEELRKRYQLKVNGLSSGSKKKPMDEAPSTLPQVNYSGGSRATSGVGLFVMFLVGLLFGAGPSIYFMNNAKGSEKKIQEDRSKILNEQRALTDSMTVLHDAFTQLALGKMKSLPEIERDMARLSAQVLEQKNGVESDFQRERARVLKKVSAGSVQDKSLRDLASARDKKLASVEARARTVLDPLVKQRDRLKDLLR